MNVTELSHILDLHHITVRDGRERADFLTSGWDTTSSSTDNVSPIGSENENWQSQVSGGR